MAQSVKVVITNRQKDVKIPSGIRLLINWMRLEYAGHLQYAAMIMADLKCFAWGM